MLYMRCTVAIIIIFSFQGCEVKDPSFIVPPAPTDQMALLAMIFNRLPPVLELSALASFDGEENIYSIEDAEVVLFENDIPIDTLVWTSNFNSSGDFLTGIYVGDTVSLTDGFVYHLKASAPGFVSATTAPKVFQQYFDNDFTVFNVTTDTLGQDEVSIDVSLQLKVIKPAEDGFFTINFFFIGDEIVDLANGLESTWRSILPTAGNVILPAPEINEVVFRRTLPSIVDFDNLQINLVRQKGYASFMSNRDAEIISAYLNMELEDIGGVFNQPQPLVSNVENGYGFWTIADTVGGEYQQ